MSILLIKCDNCKKYMTFSKAISIEIEDKSIKTIFTTKHTAYTEMEECEECNGIFCPDCSFILEDCEVCFKRTCIKCQNDYKHKH